MTAVPIRLLVADDNRSVRESIIRLVGQTHDIRAVDEAGDGLCIMDKARTQHFDLIILDITMPGKNGLDVLRELHSEMPEIPVVILSIHPPEDYEDCALSLGAAAYIPKYRAADTLIDEVRRVVAR